ncbi:MAG: hypothetical protein JKY51_09875 [Opitutaceae bacterium]|nr:hypothetical protein [Opitutaceae bacterium]
METIKWIQRFQEILAIDSWISMLKFRLQTIFSLGKKESDLDLEMRFHLENLILENLKKGIKIEQARNEALQIFGQVEEHKTQCRNTW